jgi:hypothetical protein
MAAAQYLVWPGLALLRYFKLRNGDTTNNYGFIFKKGKQKMAARALE